MDILEKVRKFATRKRALISFVVLLVSFIALNVALSKVATHFGFDTSKLLDFKIGYSPAYVHQLLEDLGTESRHAYSLLTIPDFLLGIFYWAFLTLSIGSLLNVVVPIRSIFNIALLFPIIAMLSDYTENIMSLLATANFPNESPVFAYIGNVGTILKWSFITLSFISIIVFLTIVAVKAIRNR